MGLNYMLELYESVRGIFASPIIKKNVLNIEGE